MPVRTWIAILLSAALFVTVAACDQGGDESASGAGGESVEQPVDVAQVTPVDTAADEQGDLGDGGDALDTDDPADEQSEGMVSSGEVEPLPEIEPTDPVRPTQPVGIQRHASLEDAIAAMPFTLHEPADLPEGSSRTIVQIIEPVEGETVPGLPAARLIYDIDLKGVIVLYQSPATGEPGTGEPIVIGAYEGWSDTLDVSEGDPMSVLVWEQDGVRFELRGRSIAAEALQAAAESMAPVDAEGGEE
jgi:hypothetical protein